MVSLDSGAVIAVSNVYSLYPANKEGSVHRVMQNGPPPSPLFFKTSFLKMLATRCGPLRFPRCYGLISYAEFGIGNTTPTPGLCREEFG